MYMLTALGTTWVFDGFEVSMLSLVSNQLMTAFDKSESQIGLLASVYLLGCCTGAIMFSCLAFWYGRKQLFNVTLLIYSASVIAISMSPNYVFFAICRFCTGTLTSTIQASPSEASIRQYLQPLTN
jgi:MFS family permease